MIESKARANAVNILLSLAGIGGAVLALWYGEHKDLANALIFAGGALAVALVPLNKMPPGFHALPMKALIAALATHPTPLWQRLAAMASWLLVLSGLVLAIFRD